MNQTAKRIKRQITAQEAQMASENAYEAEMDVMFEELEKMRHSDTEAEIASMNRGQERLRNAIRQRVILRSNAKDSWYRESMQRSINMLVQVFNRNSRATVNAQIRG